MDGSSGFDINSAKFSFFYSAQQSPSPNCHNRATRYANRSQVTFVVIRLSSTSVTYVVSTRFAYCSTIETKLVASEDSFIDFLCNCTTGPFSHHPSCLLIMKIIKKRTGSCKASKHRVMQHKPKQRLDFRRRRQLTIH